MSIFLIRIEIHMILLMNWKLKISKCIAIYGVLNSPKKTNVGIIIPTFPTFVFWENFEIV